MRLSINQTLASISKDGKGVTDLEMVKWANETVKKGGKNSTMRSFKDSTLSNGVFFLDLLNGVKPGIVDYSLVNKETDEESKRLNGKSEECRATILHMLISVYSQIGHFNCQKARCSDLRRARRWGPS